MRGLFSLKCAKLVDCIADEEFSIEAGFKIGVLRQATNATHLARDLIHAVDVPKPPTGGRYVAINAFRLIGLKITNRGEFSRGVVFKCAVGVVGRNGHAVFWWLFGFAISDGALDGRCGDKIAIRVDDDIAAVFTVCAERRALQSV